MSDPTFAENILAVGGLCVAIVAYWLGYWLGYREGRRAGIRVGMKYDLDLTDAAADIDVNKRRRERERAPHD